MNTQNLIDSRKNKKNKRIKIKGNKRTINQSINQSSIFLRNVVPFPLSNVDFLNICLSSNIIEEGSDMEIHNTSGRS